MRILNADTTEYPAEDDAVLRKQTVDSNLNLDDLDEQTVKSLVRFSAGLSDSNGNNSLVVGAKGPFLLPSSDPDSKYEAITKEKGDRRYWRWWRPGSNSGVPDIGIEHDVVSAIDGVESQVEAWDAARIEENSENSDLGGTWSTKFTITDDWGGLFPILGNLTVTRTVESDGESSILTFLIVSHDEIQQFEGTSAAAGWSGWVDIIQVKNYLNSRSVTLNGIQHIDIRRVITGVGSSQALALNQAVTLISPAGAFEYHNIYSPATSANYINGLVVSLNIDENGEDCAEIAEEPGIYILPGLDVEGVEDYSKLYIGPDNTILTFDFIEGSKNFGYLLDHDSKAVWLDMLGGNSTVKHEEPPTPESFTILHGWTDNETIIESDLQFAATQNEEGYRTRDSGVSPVQIFTRQCSCLRPETSYKYFFMAVPVGSGATEPAYIKFGPLTYTDDTLVDLVNYNGVDYTVLNLLESNDSDDETAVLVGAS